MQIFTSVLRSLLPIIRPVSFLISSSPLPPSIHILQFVHCTAVYVCTVRSGSLCFPCSLTLLHHPWKMKSFPVRTHTHKFSREHYCWYRQGIAFFPFIHSLEKHPSNLHLPGFMRSFRVSRVHVLCERVSSYYFVLVFSRPVNLRLHVVLMQLSIARCQRTLRSDDSHFITDIGGRHPTSVHLD